MSIVALAGGVGAAKFLAGLVRATEPSEVTIIGNTGDDATFHGLHVSPDLDIVTYTLAGLVDPQTGWGLAGDTTRALEAMASLGIDTWFRLGDADLGTHLARTTWLAEGVTLTEVTDRIRVPLGVASRILPMSDDPVRTELVTSEGVVREFQEYFVRYRYAEDIAEVRFRGAEESRPGPDVINAIDRAERVIICPSNPVVSIGPILAVPGIREALTQRRSDVFGVTPIVRGAALKGPADRLLPVVGAEPSASGVAGLYVDLCSTFVVDERDPEELGKVEKLGLTAVPLDTIMDTPEATERLAKEVVAL